VTEYGDQDAQSTAGGVPLTDDEIDDKVASFFNRPVEAIWGADHPRVVLTAEEVRVSLATVIAEVTGIDPFEVTIEKIFIDELGIDSLAAIEIAVRIEDLHGIRVRDEGLVGLRTVGDAVHYLHRALNSEQPQPPAL
jgi:acyl carrier protein